MLSLFFRGGMKSDEEKLPVGRAYHNEYHDDFLRKGEHRQDGEFQWEGELLWNGEL